MNEYCKIDLEHWKRKDLFHFYRTFAAPCFNVCVKLKADNLYQYAKGHGESFFLLSLYAILRAANSVPEMRRRVLDDCPVEFQQVAVMTPVMTEHEMFCQVWCEYFDTFGEFKAAIAPKIEAAKTGDPAPMPEHGEDFICASCVPWLHFESIAQAEYHADQTVPILAWGKLENGLIPIGVKLNHCFVDGLHVSRFFENIQHSFADPERNLIQIDSSDK